METMVISDTTTSEQSADDNFFDALEYLENSCKAKTSFLDESCHSMLSSASKVSFAQIVVTEVWGTATTEKTRSKSLLSKLKKIHAGVNKKVFCTGKGLALKKQPKASMYY
jgi:hypothetical protein